MDDEPFTLVPPPTTRKAKFVAWVQAEHDQAERLGRREGWFTEFRARAYLITSGCDLVDVHDPEEGATLADVINLLVARVEAAHNGKNPAIRWWARDLAIWQAGRLLATIRPTVGGMPVVTVFTEGREGSRVPHPGVSAPAVSQPQERRP